MAPPGYRRQVPPRRPKLEPFIGVIDRILENDPRLPRKQRHTAQRIFEKLRVSSDVELALLAVKHGMINPILGVFGESPMYAPAVD